MALENQLEGTRITRNGDPQIAASPLKVVAGGSQCASRSTISLETHQNRVGCSLKRAHCKGNLVPLRKQVAHKLSGTKGGFFLALKDFQDLCLNNIVFIATDNTTVVAYINKQGRMKSGPQCAHLWRILT